MNDQQPGSAVALSPARAFQQELDAFGPQFSQALPAHVSVEKFKRVLLTAISQNPDLMQANRRTLFTAAVRCAADGLLPDGREAALVIYNTKVKRRGKDGIDREEFIKAVQFMPMVAGVRKRMRNSGDVLSAIAEVVYKNDHFEYRLGDDAMISHGPPPLGDDRGVAVGAYAIIRLKSGETLRDVMSVADIEKARAQSRAKDSLMWKSFWGEGAKKTVLRRCAKSAPQSAEVEALLDREDDAPMLSTHDLAALPAPEREPQREDFVDEETGEVVEEQPIPPYDTGSAASMRAHGVEPTERRVAPTRFTGRDRRANRFQYEQASRPGVMPLAEERPGADVNILAETMPVDVASRRGEDVDMPAGRGATAPPDRNRPFRPSAPEASERHPAGESSGEPAPAGEASLSDLRGNGASERPRDWAAPPEMGKPISPPQPQGSPPAHEDPPATAVSPGPTPGKRAASPEQREATKRWKEIRAMIDESTAVAGVMGLDGLEGSHPWVALEEALRLAEPPEVAAGAMQQLRDRIAKKRAELGGTKEGGY